MTVNYLSNAASIAQTALNSTLNNTSQTAQTSGAQQDSSQISDFAKLMKQLESLQQSDPSAFKEATANIATKLEDAAKTAADSGNNDEASALNNLAAKFKTSSETGEMPDLRPTDSSQAQGGHRAHGHHHGGHRPDADGDSDGSASTTSASSSTSSSLSQLLSQYQQSSATDPMSILSSIMSDVLSSSSSSSSTTSA